MTNSVSKQMLFSQPKIVCKMYSNDILWRMDITVKFITKYTMRDKNVFMNNIDSAHQR